MNHVQFFFFFNFFIDDDNDDNYRKRAWSKHGITKDELKLTVHQL